MANRDMGREQCPTEPASYSLDPSMPFEWAEYLYNSTGNYPVNIDVDGPDLGSYNQTLRQRVMRSLDPVFGLLIGRTRPAKQEPRNYGGTFEVIEYDLYDDDEYPYADMEDDQDGYVVFTTPELRKDLYEAGKGIAEYARSNRIGTVCFVDRSARPAYVAFNTYWNNAFGDEEKPDIRFINPKGCMSRQDFESGRCDIKEVTLADSYKQGTIESVHDIRDDYDIVWDIRSAMRASDKADKPILLFDTCVHTGRSLLPIINKFVMAGVSDIHVGVMSENGSRCSDLIADLDIMDGELPAGGCYSFGQSNVSKRVYEEITAQPNTDVGDRIMARVIRTEIKRAVQEEWDRQAAA